MSSLTSNQLRQKYLDFFKARGHVVVPSSPLVPQNDPTTLFTGSGMQPMIPYLLGQPHPAGTRIVDSQTCFRTVDIPEVGDNRHTTFFEMLGNWSLGDYFKKEQLTWFFEFLTQEVGLDPNKLYVSVFVGDPENNIPKDDESVQIWKGLFKKHGIDAKDVELFTEEKGAELGMQSGRIFYYDVKKNWWSRAGTPAEMPAGEPGGPDSEVFYEFTSVEHDPKFGKHCHPNCDCGRFLEIGNSVFMKYQKQSDGSFKPLEKETVDFGGGFERILACALDNSDIFKTDLFQPIIKEIELATAQKYQGDYRSSMRIIADHLKAATFMMVQGIEPSNKQQGYFLRRLLRRAVVKIRQLVGGETSPNPLLKGEGFSPSSAEEGVGGSLTGSGKSFEEIFSAVVKQVFEIYKGVYLQEDKDFERVLQVGHQELKKFQQTLNKGMSKITKQKVGDVDGAFAFDLFQSYGFPFELTKELVEQKGGSLRKEEFDAEFEKHQQLSRTASAGMFKGGLADHSENTVKYHTATHLLHAVLRKVLGEHVQQKGSNITGERMRFDFTHTGKMTEEEIKRVEELINQKISEDLPVTFVSKNYGEAIQEGALAFFGEKYPEQVKVYTIGDPDGKYFSKEICGGPHVSRTGEIGRLKIMKETAASAGVRRIYAELV